MVSREAHDVSITKRFRKLSLQCHPELAETQKGYVRLQRSHCLLTDHNIRKMYDCDGRQAAWDVFIFKNNQYTILELCFSFGRMLTVILSVKPCSVLFCCVGAMRLTYFSEDNTKVLLRKIEKCSVERVFQNQS